MIVVAKTKCLILTSPPPLDQCHKSKVILQMGSKGGEQGPETAQVQGWWSSFCSCRLTPGRLDGLWQVTVDAYQLRRQQLRLCLLYFTQYLKKKKKNAASLREEITQFLVYDVQLLIGRVRSFQRPSRRRIGSSVHSQGTTVLAHGAVDSPAPAQRGLDVTLVVHGSRFPLQPTTPTLEFESLTPLP